MQTQLALVQHPGAMPDGKSRHVQVHLVVGQHEADAFVLTDRTPESLAVACVVDRDVVGAPRGAEPAHAMCQARG